MNFRKRIAFGLLGLSLAAGCASTPTRVDSGSIAAATFDFVARNTGPQSVIDERDEAVHAMIQAAITANLAEKGVARVDSGSDIKVAYLVIVGNNVSTTAVNDYFGYGRDDVELADKAFHAYTGKNKNPDYFEAGTLLVDLLDARTFKLLRRAYVVRPIDRTATPEVRQARIQDAVNEVLSDLRIKR